MLVMSFLLINSLTFAAVGICTSLPTSYKAVGLHVAVLHHGHLRLHYRLGVVSPLTRRFDTVKIYYYTNLSSLRWRC